MASQIAAGIGAPIDGESGAILFIPFARDSQANPLSQGISVIGAFNTPRFLETQVALPLFEVIALAGGPSTESPQRRIQHIRQGSSYTFALDYRLRRFLRRGGALSSVMIQPGDVLYLRPQRENAWEQVVGGLSDIAVIGSAALLFVTLGNQL